MKDGTMSIADPEEEFNLMLESSPAARESSSPKEQKEDDSFVTMQTELHSKGAVLTKAWSDLFSFITKYQAELVVKENMVEIGEKEIEQRKRQLEEMKPVVDAGNEEVSKLQDEIRMKEGLLSKAQSQLSVKERLLQRVQSDLSCNRELLEKAQSDLLDKQNNLIRYRGDLEHLKSELKVKQEQIQIKDNLLKKLQNQLMKENAELKEQLELERRSHELEKQSHELTKRSLVSQSMQSERRKRQRAEDVPAIVEIPDSPPTLDLSDVAEDFGLSNIISMATNSSPLGQDSQQRKPSSELDTSQIAPNVPSHSPSYGDSECLHHMPTSTTLSQCDFSTRPKVSRSSRFMSSPSVTPSQTSVPSTCISDSIELSHTAMISSDTFFPLSVSEDVKPDIDTMTSSMQIDSDSQGNMPTIKPGTPTSGTSDSNQGPVPVSGPIANPAMSPGGSRDGRADGKMATEALFPSELWSGGQDMAINMVWSVAQSVDSAASDDNDLQVWSLVETTDLTQDDDIDTVDLTQDDDFEPVSLVQDVDFETVDSLPGDDDSLQVWSLVETTDLLNLAPEVYFETTDLAQDGDIEARNLAVDDDSDRQSDVGTKSGSGFQPECTPQKIRVYKKKPSDYKKKARKRFKCDVCQKAFCHEGFLRKHKREHTRRFECKCCQKTFSGTAYLATHEKIHADDKLLRRPRVLIDRVSHVRKEDSRIEVDLPLLELQNNTDEKKSLECRYCKKAFASKDSLTRHELTHNFCKKEFRCNFCKKAFSRKDEVAIHELTHIDTGDKKFPTSEKESKELCEEEISQKVNLIKCRKDKFWNPLHCRYCEKIFFWPDSLKRHELVHTGELAFKCGSCEKAFCRHDHLKRHEKTHTRFQYFHQMVVNKAMTTDKKDNVTVGKSNHRTVGKNGQVTVGKNYHMTVGRNDHVTSSKSNHVTVSKNDCVKISKKDQTPLIKKDHLTVSKKDQRIVSKKQVTVKKQAIAGKKPFRCSICKRIFSRRQHVKRHEETHARRPEGRTGIKRFKCSICNKPFSRREHVKRHERIHARKQERCSSSVVGQPSTVQETTYTEKKVFKCFDCMLVFSNQGDLTKHEQTRSCNQPKDPKKPYRCARPGCKKAFARQDHLKHHELTHTRIWQYQCSHCEKTFKWKSILRIHERNHSRAKHLPVFECRFCHVEFVYKSVYEKHVCKYNI
ncbi:zinc finger protein 26-like isoform X1 [Lineus longissimus]|uniref:zinc finger protein 26-like isoform X1 n=1 Tax=Lineus longissimus TaxID=88925 RepID=UPI00315DB2A8